MLTSAAAYTWACLHFPTMLTSRLSATESDALAPSALYALCGYTLAHCVTGRDRLLVLVLSKSCAIHNRVWHSVGLIQCHPEWIGIGVHKNLILDRILFSSCPHILSRFASMPFHCMP